MNSLIDTELAPLASLALAEFEAGGKIERSWSERLLRKPVRVESRHLADISPPLPAHTDYWQVRLRPDERGGVHLELQTRELGFEQLSKKPYNYNLIHYNLCGGFSLHLPGFQTVPGSERIFAAEQVSELAEARTELEAEGETHGRAQAAAQQALLALPELIALHMKRRMAVSGALPGTALSDWEESRVRVYPVRTIILPGQEGVVLRLVIEGMSRDERGYEGETLPLQGLSLDALIEAFSRVEARAFELNELRAGEWDARRREEAGEQADLEHQRELARQTVRALHR